MSYYWYMETIAERIARIRAEKRISQEMLGERLGKSQRMISVDLRRDDDSFSMGLLKSIADVLDVPVSRLIFPREELDIMREPDPVIAPIIAEVSRIASIPDREKSDSYLAVLLASVRAMK